MERWGGVRGGREGGRLREACRSNVEGSLPHDPPLIHLCRGVSPSMASAFGGRASESAHGGASVHSPRGSAFPAYGSADPLEDPADLSAR